MSHQAFLPRPLPEGLAALADLALDLRWTWSHGADHLWRAINPDTWDLTRNPWLLLQEAPAERLAALARDVQFRHDLAVVVAARSAYQDVIGPLDQRAGSLERPVAYFSMEFGLGEAIPLYAGGLGILAGDHLKAASDLGVPIVGLGILYQEGYFRQALDSNGRQEELYPFNDPTRLPIQPVVVGPGKDWLTIAIDLPGRKLWLRAWQATVGRVTLFLLDANVAANSPSDRGITAKLYSDGPETRIRQEMVLGIGGYRLLDALGIEPGACHLNEGHAAFAVLERARLAMRTHRLTFAEALTATRAANIFTTHTSVAAAFDSFSPALLARYLPEDGPFLRELGIGLPELLALGRAPGAEYEAPFRPAYLAARGAGQINAVSALHAETSREIFGGLFPRLPLVEVPITHVTNGVHVPSWDSVASDELWTSVCGSLRWRGDVGGHENAIAAVDDRTLWSLRARSRATLVTQVRARLARQLARRNGATNWAQHALDPDVLTLGFARRFAEYKRPNLLLGDPNRLRNLLTDPRRPVQLVVAGKAHPEDWDGKGLVEAWARFADDPAVRARCVFLEDYDLALAQELVQGVDVWINTPRRPWEACGTSGMKVLVNGGLNLSVLDGWWAEVRDPDVGWNIGEASIGRPPEGTNTRALDEHDASSLFERIERDVVPRFYDRDKGGIPEAWIRMVRASMSRLTPRFSANRMMTEYVTRFYRPAELAFAERLRDGASAARELQRGMSRISSHWSEIRFGRLDIDENDRERRYIAEVFLNDVSPQDVAVELYADAASTAAEPERVAMKAIGPVPGTSHGHLFEATTSRDRPAASYTPRVVPASPIARLPLELPLVTWRS